MNDLQELIELSKIVSMPWRIATYVLSALLGVSVLGNIYMATVENIITIEAENNIESVISQKNE